MTGDDSINLKAGHPNEEDLPLDLIKAAAADVSVDAFNYGVDEGDSCVLQEMARFLNESYSTEAVGPENLMVTGGCSQSLEVCCTTLPKVAAKLRGSGGAAPKKRVIFVEKPTYHLALQVFDAHGYAVVDIDGDSEGLSVEALDEKVAEHGLPAFVYIIPTGHNPTGQTMSEQRRRDLIAFAQRHNVMLVADEVYHFLHYGDEAPPPSFSKLLHETGSDWVVSVSSFSKILSPGLRVGWLHASPSTIATVIENCGVAHSAGCLAQYSSHVVAGVLKQAAFKAHLAGLCERFAAKRKAALGTLAENFTPLGVTFTVPNAGYFIWCTLPPRVAATDLLKAVQGKVNFADGRQFFVASDVAQDISQQSRHFRLSFTCVSSTLFAQGVQTLAKAVRQLV